MSRLMLPRIYGSIRQGHQRIRDQLVAAMRREPIAYVDELPEADEDGQSTHDRPRWQGWAMLAIVLVALIAFLPVAAGTVALDFLPGQKPTKQHKQPTKTTKPKKPDKPPKKPVKPPKKPVKPSKPDPGNGGGPDPGNGGGPDPGNGGGPDPGNGGPGSCKKGFFWNPSLKRCQQNVP